MRFAFVVVGSVVAIAAAPGCTERIEVGGDARPPGLDARAGDAGRCDDDTDCADRIVCSIDDCVDGTCEHRPCVGCCMDDLVCDVSLGCVTAPDPCTSDADCDDAVRCTLDACDGSFCEHRPQDGLCEEGEICLAAVGCIPRPPDTCTAPSECASGPCAGVWQCQPEFGCVFERATDCADTDACTADSCDPAMGCVHRPPDVDMDGYVDDACGGDDCDDGDPTRHPMVMEVCDGAIDDDCDTRVDEGCCTAGPCTTACGSTGTRDCATGACLPPAEACNGTDDDCDGTADDGFECTGAATRSCATSCGSTGMQACSGCAWGACTVPAETCNAVDDDCDTLVDDGFACVRGTSGNCPTSCGSMGTRTCASDCSWDVCAPPAETCNAADDDCDGARDETFACVAGATGSCTTGCGSTGSSTCASDCTPGSCTPPAESCNGSDDDCDGTRDEGYACIAGTSGPCPTTCGSTGMRSCTGACTWDLCFPPAESCNGVDDDCDTACDDGFMCCRGAPRACSTLGFYAGTALCSNDCSGFDTSTCTNCGNGTRNPGEQCDGVDLGGATCTSIGMGFGSGTLRCAAGCVYDTSMCSRCGNGTIDAGEQCDGTNLGGATCTSIGMGFIGGTLRCQAAPSCRYDTTMCTVWNPSGTYTTSPRPMFSCTFFGIPAVSFNIGSFTFIDDGTMLRVGGAPCGPTTYMVGATARNPTRSFDVTCTYAGTCAETYRLVGMFTSDNQWSGTFYASYLGSCDTCDDPPQPRTWSVTGTRP
jgi:hypothetical protein